MTTLDILYIALASGFIVLVGFLCYALFQFSMTLVSFREVAHDVKDVTHDVNEFRSKVKTETLGTVVSILSLFKSLPLGKSR